MDKADIIKQQLEKVGNTVYLQDGNWTSMPFKASVSRLWRKKSSNFETVYTELGQASSTYYLYIGPYNHDISTLSDEGILIFNNDKYEFKCIDAVCSDDSVIYYSGVMRKIKECDFDENC